MGFKYICVVVVWLLVLSRSKCIVVLLNAFKLVFLRKIEAIFGTKLAILPPLDSLYSELSKEDNAFAQFLFNPFGLAKREGK